ncbi:MAG: T9SS type A sorting domain-containing protein [Bacteroidales bacterium]|nr:T9SS type A sorting domain-containing protein [Bacteroidales bacterium]
MLLLCSLCWAQKSKDPSDESVVVISSSYNKNATNVLNTNGDYTFSGGGTIIVEGSLRMTGNLIISPDTYVIIKGQIHMDNASYKFTLGKGATLAVLGFYDANHRVAESSLNKNMNINGEVYIEAYRFQGKYSDPKIEAEALARLGYAASSDLLPIELTSFTASQNRNDIEIVWTTNSEVNNDYFTVEYSVDGVSFKTLETVAGSGTTSVANEYAVSTDASELSGMVYFRLKQTDYNGEYSYSDVIALQVESANATDLVIYPNPATEYITISGAVTSAFVSDMHGRRIAVPQTSANTFNVAGLSVGTYYMVATTENGKTVLPFVKE